LIKKTPNLLKSVRVFFIHVGDISIWPLSYTHQALSCCCRW